ncbi:type I restriction endonuclease [Collinsella ureilytica]|uniref:type I restriction endonuclease n=1 Tax=Collinsella ureilytica TaxID=2869515 RepID=UPI0027D1F4E5|nr:type I restriction endonuclease [Collinsella urealyticum]
MIFDREAAFEEAVITVLKQHGWDDEEGVLRYPTEQDLIDNWARILFKNNSRIDRLNGCPLTQGEMAQIIEQIETLKTPLALNGFINGKVVPITRDNPDDTLHFGETVYLAIYDRDEIAAGKSRYQIAQQPVYPAKNKILNDRRGDLCLLINGMPVIHIELKRSGTSVKEATGQIEKYAHEGVFTGLFRLVQIFVGMTPDEALYFANPGSRAFNKNKYVFVEYLRDFASPDNSYVLLLTHILISLERLPAGFRSTLEGKAVWWLKKRSGLRDA